MSNGYTLAPVSGPKEQIPGLLDSSLLPLRFGDLDQVRDREMREGRERERRERLEGRERGRACRGGGWGRCEGGGVGVDPLFAT